MSQGEGAAGEGQPLEITIRGVIDWNDNEIITNLPEQPEASHFLRVEDRSVLPRITRATLMLDGGGTEILTNIRLTGFRSSTNEETTTYKYSKLGP
jgi:hypothetical protein